MSMHDRSLTQRSGFAASRLELGVAHGLITAFANALGREQLDYVGPLLNPFPHKCTYLIRSSRSLIQRLKRSDDAGTRNTLARNRVSQVSVNWCAQALNGRESRHEGKVRISARVQSEFSW